MATSRERTEAVRKELLRAYTVYDEHVDVVSAFEWLFTGEDVDLLPDTVQHFERFPKIKREDGNNATPDFTVFFRDGEMLVAEIARLAVHDNSVEKLCEQLSWYDRIGQGPCGDGLAEASNVSVVALVPAAVGPAAIRRILYERMHVAGHPYKPGRSPTIVQFFRNDQQYIFQRIPDPANGRISDGARDIGVGSRLEGESLTIAAHRFAATKAARSFINDEVNDLYLASHLWMKTWPNLHGRASGDEKITISETTRALQGQQGVGRAKDVKRAMNLLQDAGLAEHQEGGEWIVHRRLLGRSGDRDVHDIIARRAVSPETARLRDTRSRSGVQESLW